MDKRFFLALFLTGIVLVVTPLLMPTRSEEHTSELQSH